MRFKINTQFLAFLDVILETLHCCTGTSLAVLDTHETESYTVLPRGRTVLRKTVRPPGKTVYDSVSNHWWSGPPQIPNVSASPFPVQFRAPISRHCASPSPGLNPDTVLPRGRTVLRKTVLPRGETVYDSVSTYSKLANEVNEEIWKQSLLDHGVKLSPIKGQIKDGFETKFGPFKSNETASELLFKLSMQQHILSRISSQVLLFKFGIDEVRP